MSRQGQQRRSASEWSELVERQAVSGLSQRDFCEAEGIALSTFTYWKRKLAGISATRDLAETAQPLFTPIRALPDTVDASADDTPAGSGWAIELDLGDGLRLTIRKVA